MQDQPVIAALAKCPPERDLARSLLKFHQKVLFFNYDRPCLQAGIPTHVHVESLQIIYVLVRLNLPKITLFLSLYSPFHSYPLLSQNILTEYLS